jgi:hypothetical protein
MTPARQKQVTLYQPGDRVPDMRNTILWKESLVLEQGALQELTFRAPDQKGQFVILIRASHPQGGIFSAVSTISVE